MLGFEGKKEVIKGEEAAMVLVRLSNALSGKPSKEDMEAENNFAKAREMYTVVWKKSPLKSPQYQIQSVSHHSNAE